MATKKDTKTKNIAIVPNFDMRKISQEIVGLKFEHTNTIQECFDMFYKIMRKHGVKRGTQTFHADGSKGGINQANFEWTICKELFKSQFDSYFVWNEFLGKFPKDLEVYKTKKNG